jgi:hypothetical protein
MKGSKGNTSDKIELDRNRSGFSYCTEDCKGQFEDFIYKSAFLEGVNWIIASNESFNNHNLWSLATTRAFNDEINIELSGKWGSRELSGRTKLQTMSLRSVYRILDKHQQPLSSDVSLSYASKQHVVKVLDNDFELQVQFVQQHLFSPDDTLILKLFMQVDAHSIAYLALYETYAVYARIDSEYLYLLDQNLNVKIEATSFNYDKDKIEIFRENFVKKKKQWIPIALSARQNAHKVPDITMQNEPDMPFSVQTRKRLNTSVFM